MLWSFLYAGRMLSLSRAVVSGVVRAPAAVTQGGVTAITRFNSTAQVHSVYSVKTKINQLKGKSCVDILSLIFPESS